MTHLAKWQHIVRATLTQSNRVRATLIQSHWVRVTLIQSRWFRVTLIQSRWFRVTLIQSHSDSVTQSQSHSDSVTLSQSHSDYYKNPSHTATAVSLTRQVAAHSIATAFIMFALGSNHPFIANYFSTKLLNIKIFGHSRDPVHTDITSKQSDSFLYSQHFDEGTE